MKKILLSILTIFLIFSFIKFSFGEPQIEIEGYSINPKEVYPGCEFTLSMNIKNNSLKDKAKSITIEIKRIENRNDLYIFYPKNKTTTRKIEELDANKEIKVEFSFEVDKNAQTGLYRLVVTISWRDESNKTYLSEEIIGVSVSPPSIENRPLLTIKLFTYSPIPVEGGGTFDLNLNIENIGGKDAKNIKVEIKRVEGSTALLYFSPKESGNVIYLNRIQKGERSSIKFSFNVDENIKTGLYNLEVQMNYEDEARLFYSNQEIVGINVVEKRDKANVDIISSKVVPERILPGDTFELNLKIKNDGNLLAKKIKIYPSNIEGEGSLKYFSLHGEGVKIINYLNINEETEIKFNFIVDKKIESKLYNIVFNITYEDEKNKIYSNAKSVGILISSDAPDLILSNYSFDPESIKPNTTFKLNLIIENRGNLSAKDIKITLQNLENNTSLYPFSIFKGSGSQYLEEIKENEKKYVIFELKVDKDAQSKNYTIIILIDYKDKSLRSYTKNERINIFIGEKEKLTKPIVLIENVSTEPKLIGIGTNFKLNLTLLNNGGEVARNVKIQFSGVGVSGDLYPFTILNTSNTIFIGDLKENERKNVEVNFSVSSEAKEGPYNLIINITYENSENFSDSQKIGIVVKKIEPQKSLNLILSNYKVNPNIVNPGDIVEIDYTITNISKENAYNITHKIDKLENSNSLYPFSPIYSTNINKTNLILGGNSISYKIKFFVSPDAESKTYNLSLSIKYEDINGVSYETSGTIGVVVLRKQILAIFNFLCPERVKTNQSFTLSCEIGNIGNYPVKGVILYLKGLPVFGGDKFIGTLESGNYDTYEFETKIEREGEYKGEIILQYVDDTNEIHEIKKEFKIVVEEYEESQLENKTQKLSFWQKLWRFILRLFGIIK
ncbi:MAG: CARDB domain-containing protein [Caldisericia bacterium]|jgi:hypothetical protein|nr:CARDB domain-containing protein [Caldisericia bacterium]